MFKVGDKVRREEPAFLSARPGEVYTISDVNGKILSFIEIPGGYLQERFTLVESNSSMASATVTASASFGASPDPNQPYPNPNQPYPNPEREAAEQQLQDLREYKRKMRDFLYGTSSD